ncbi:MAG: class I SAM-dependent methyltransferase [Kofleriaceae bacterium]
MADDDSRAGHRYDLAEVAAWAHQTHAANDAALARAFEPPPGVPRIMVGPSDGKTLQLLMRMIGAVRVVEVGTLVGYSTIHLARGLAPGGHVWSVEFSPVHAEHARGNLAAAGLAEAATVVVGAGVEVLPTLVAHGPFDAVFIDADKENYANYGRWALANLRPGGLVIGDNAYLFGGLLGHEPRAVAMREFHELVAGACDSVCLQTPEGMVVGIKR